MPRRVGEKKISVRVKKGGGVHVGAVTGLLGEKDTGKRVMGGLKKKLNLSD